MPVKLPIVLRRHLIKLKHPEYECIALDIMLPGGSGLQLLQELKKNNKSDGVIIILG